MISSILVKIKSFLVVVINYGLHIKPTFTAFTLKKKIYACFAAVGGISLLALPFMAGQNSSTNQQINDNFSSEPVAQVSDTPNTASEIQNSSQSTGADSTTTETKPVDQTHSSSSSSISFQSSVTGNNGGPAVTHVSEETTGGQKTQTVTHESGDGSSKETFRVDSGSDAQMKVKERNGRIRIDINENKVVK